MSELIGVVLQPKEFITSKDAEKAYTYLPNDIDYPTLEQIDDLPLDETVLKVKFFDATTRWTWLPVLAMAGPVS